MICTLIYTFMFNLSWTWTTIGRVTKLWREIWGGQKIWLYSVIPCTVLLNIAFSQVQNNNYTQIIPLCRVLRRYSENITWNTPYSTILSANILIWKALSHHMTLKFHFWTSWEWFSTCLHIIKPSLNGGVFCLILERRQLMTQRITPMNTSSLQTHKVEILHSDLFLHNLGTCCSYCV